MKKIETLFRDIYGLFFAEDHKIEKENMDTCLNHVQDTLKDFLETRQDLGNTEQKLRVSKLGVKNRKAWYEWNLTSEEGTKEIDVMKDGNVLMKFLIGHITEAILLFLAKEAGHTVEHEQSTITIEGIEGHVDAVIDGHLTDLKTASFYGYNKFVNGAILAGDDPYGYVEQMSGYKEGLEDIGVKLEDTKYWWAINKSDQDMVMVPIDDSDLIDAKARVRELKEVIQLPEPPPEKCYDAVPQNKDPSKDNGNRVLHTQCGYCPFKHICWADANEGKGLRTFMYGKGDRQKPLHFTHVEKTPRVEEVIYGKEESEST